MNKHISSLPCAIFGYLSPEKKDVDRFLGCLLLPLFGTHANIFYRSLLKDQKKVCGLMRENRRNWRKEEKRLQQAVALSLRQQNTKLFLFMSDQLRMLHKINCFLSTKSSLIFINNDGQNFQGTKLYSHTQEEEVKTKVMEIIEQKQRHFRKI